MADLPPPDLLPPDLLVVGAGIAGASLAYFAARAGLSVVVVNAGAHTASQVPSALLNPVRGQSGKVPPRAAEGLALTWSLVAVLEAQGFRIPHGRTGVVRPVPDAKTQAKFQRNLGELPHEWRAADTVPTLAAGWHAALHLPQGGWVDGAALCRALLAASGARQVVGEVTRWSPQSVGLQGGQTLHAGAVVWCGGSFGAGLLPQASRLPRARHRAGTLLRLAQSSTQLPLSFGAYLAPSSKGGVLGATFEAPAEAWQPERLPLRSLAWLLGKGERLTSLQGLEVVGHWAGTRLSGLQVGRVEADGARASGGLAGGGLAGGYVLAGLGSKGFLLGPLLARELAAEVRANSRGAGKPTQKPLQ